MIYIWVFPEQLNTYNTKQTNKLMNFGSKTAVAIAYFLVLNFEGHFLISWSLSHKNLYMASWILTLSDILYSHTHTHTHTSMLICYTWDFLPPVRIIKGKTWPDSNRPDSSPPPCDCRWHVIGHVRDHCSRRLQWLWMRCQISAVMTCHRISQRLMGVICVSHVAPAAPHFLLTVSSPPPIWLWVITARVFNFSLPFSFQPCSSICKQIKAPHSFCICVLLWFLFACPFICLDEIRSACQREAVTLYMNEGRLSVQLLQNSGAVEVERLTETQLCVCAPRINRKSTLLFKWNWCTTQLSNELNHVHI